MKRILVSAFLFGLSAQAAPKDFCPPGEVPERLEADLLNSSSSSHFVEKLGLPEEQTLAEFSAGSMVPTTARPLVNNSNIVIKVQDEHGLPFVIRRSTILEGSKKERPDYPVFEEFASRFMRQAPDVKQPAVRTLSAKDSKAVVDRLRNESGIMDFDETRGVVFNPNRVSVSLFYPGESGSDYLARLGIVGKAREMLSLLLGAGHVPIFRNTFINSFPEYWRKATPVERKTIQEDLGMLIPALRNVAEDVFPYAVRRHVDEILEPRISEVIVSRTFNRIPANIRVQLADQWALREVLGINDFGSGNWLIHRDSVIGVDVALRSIPFVEGSSNARTSYAGIPSFNPSGDGLIGKMFKANISSPVRQYLQSLTRDGIRDLAKSSGLQINDRQLDGIMTRILAILK